MMNQGSKAARSNKPDMSPPNSESPPMEMQSIVPTKDDLTEDSSNDNEKDMNTNKDTQLKSNNNSKKRPLKKDEKHHGVKRSRWDNRRIPNIAAELAKNRNTARGSSANSTTAPSSPTMNQMSNVPPAGIIRSSSESHTPEPPDSKRTQVKISSLLSSSGGESNSAPLPPIKPENEIPPLSQISISTPTHAAVESHSSPKVILPTQLPGALPSDSRDSTADTPGVLIARINSPVSMPPQPHLKRAMSNMTGEKKLQADLIQKSNSTSSIPRSKEKHGSTESRKKNSSSNSSASRESSKTNSASSVKKEGSTGVKRDNNSSDKDKRDGHSGSVKRETPSSHSSKSNEKKDNKSTSKSSAKKENGGMNSNNNNDNNNSNNNNNTNTNTNNTNNNNNNHNNNASNGKSTDTKKKPHVKRDSAPTSKAKTPKKLVPPPPVKSPSLLEVLEQGKNQDDINEPALIVDVPLYSTEDNEYLDENGQVVFNFYKVIQDKLSAENGGGSLAELKAAKRNLFGQISGSQMEGATEEEEEEDIEEVDEVEEGEEEEEGEGPKQNVSPKKKSHPNKGKSLIGKYDTEDPFIDDTELLWEEQRAVAKDGFFVYFGPLIEKGHYASLERADGTMKRGGVKNK